MTPRLQIAAMCLQAKISLNEQLNRPVTDMVKDCLRYADALIEQEKATRPKGQTQCEKCDGTKEIYDDFAHEYFPCPRCNGTGVER